MARQDDAFGEIRIYLRNEPGEQTSAETQQEPAADAQPDGADKIISETDADGQNSDGA
jgi:hypothetical protein